MSYRDLPYVDDPFASAGGSDGDYSETITTATTAADTRNVQELQARIKKANGVVVAGPNSSDYIVAVNNTLRFSVTRRADGAFEIRESQYFWLLVGAGLIVGVLLITK